METKKEIEAVPKGTFDRLYKMIDRLRDEGTRAPGIVGALLGAASALAATEGAPKFSQALDSLVLSRGWK